MESNVREAPINDPDALVDALEDATASLESVMAHYGSSMPEGDRVGRERVIRKARAALNGPLQ